MAEVGPITPAAGSLAATGRAPVPQFKFPTVFPGGIAQPLDLREGQNSLMNIAQATFIAGRGVLRRVVVVVSAAAASQVDDTVAGQASAAGTLILSIPASTTAGTIYPLHWPIKNGILITPGAGVTLAASFD